MRRYLSSAELYDPASGTWTATGSLATALTFTRRRASQWQGPDGRGTQWRCLLSSAELYDPASGLWRSTGSLATAPFDVHTATLLPNGKVLVAGGNTMARLEQRRAVDPAPGSWRATGSLATARRRTQGDAAARMARCSWPEETMAARLEQRGAV